jgi:hypothetical protein
MDQARLWVFAELDSFKTIRRTRAKRREWMAYYKVLINVRTVSPSGHVKKPNVSVAEGGESGRGEGL